MLFTYSSIAKRKTVKYRQTINNLVQSVQLSSFGIIPAQNIQTVNAFFKVTAVGGTCEFIFLLLNGTSKKVNEFEAIPKEFRGSGNATLNQIIEITANNLFGGSFWNTSAQGANQPIIDTFPSSIFTNINQSSNSSSNYVNNTFMDYLSWGVYNNFSANLSGELTVYVTYSV